METICVHVSALNTVVVLASEPNVTVLQQIGPILEFINNEWVIDSKLYEVWFRDMSCIVKCRFFHISFSETEIFEVVLIELIFSRFS